MEPTEIYSADPSPPRNIMKEIMMPLPDHAFVSSSAALLGSDKTLLIFLMAEQRSMQRSMWNRFKARAVWFRASFNHVNMFQQFSTYFNLLFVVLISPFATKVKAMTLKLANSCPGWKNPSPRLPQLNSWGHWMILVYINYYIFKWYNIITYIFH